MAGEFDFDVNMHGSKSGVDAEAELSALREQIKGATDDSAQYQAALEKSASVLGEVSQAEQDLAAQMGAGRDQAEAIRDRNEAGKESAEVTRDQTEEIRNQTNAIIEQANAQEQLKDSMTGAGAQYEGAEKYKNIGKEIGEAGIKMGELRMGARLLGREIGISTYLIRAMFNPITAGIVAIVLAHKWIKKMNEALQASEDALKGATRSFQDTGEAAAKMATRAIDASEKEQKAFEDQCNRTIKKIGEEQAAWEKMHAAITKLRLAQANTPEEKAAILQASEDEKRRNQEKVWSEELFAKRQAAASARKLADELEEKFKAKAGGRSAEQVEDQLKRAQSDKALLETRTKEHEAAMKGQGINTEGESPSLMKKGMYAFERTPFMANLLTLNIPALYKDMNKSGKELEETWAKSQKTFQDYKNLQKKNEAHVAELSAAEVLAGGAKTGREAAKNLTKESADMATKSGRDVELGRIAAILARITKATEDKSPNLGSMQTIYDASQAARAILAGEVVSKQQAAAANKMAAEWKGASLENMSDWTESPEKFDVVVNNLHNHPKPTPSGHWQHTVYTNPVTPEAQARASANAAEIAEENRVATEKRHEKAMRDNAERIADNERRYQEDIAAHAARIAVRNTAAASVMGSGMNAQEIANYADSMAKDTQTIKKAMARAAQAQSDLASQVKTIQSK